MPVGQATTAADAQSFIRKSYIPNVQFTVNGSVVRATQKVGELVEGLPGKLDIFYKSRSKDFTQAVCLVRVKGMYMFTRRIADEIKGVIIAEITGRSTDILYSNRDNIRDDATADFLDRYINELAADTTSKLTPKQTDYAKYFEGTGKFKAESARMESEMLMQMGAVEPDDNGKSKPRTLSRTQADALMATIERHVEPEEETQGRPLDLRPAPATARAMIDVEVSGPEQVQAIAKQLAWEPDFLVYAPVKKDDWGSAIGERINVSVKFEPQKMTPGLRKLARFWAEMCRFVLLQLGSKEEYGVGWCFAEIGRGGFAAAMHMQLRGADWLLLNPYVRGHVDNGEFYSLANKEHVNAIYAMAVHECTHMANSIGRHDEAFASALTWNVARTANRGRQIEAIRKAVVARGAAVGKIGELGTPERRTSDPAGGQTLKSLKILRDRMAQRGYPLMSEMDAETAAAYSLYDESNGDVEKAVKFARRKLDDYGGGHGAWRDAVAILVDLLPTMKTYTRQELTNIFDQRTSDLTYSRMSAEQAAATMLAYHDLSEGIVEADAKAATFASDADEARRLGRPSARDYELAAYAWQDASFILKSLADREAESLMRGGEQTRQEDVDAGWTTPNRRRG